MTRLRSALEAEASAGGRVMISVVITATLAAIVIGSLPESALRRALVTHAGPALDVVGIQQRWDLFAPDPRRVSIDLGAHISYADGRVETWRLPRRGPFLGAYSDPRWRKLAERTIVGGGDEALAQDIARWLARWRSALRPRQVQLFARYARLAPPGASAAVRPAYVQRTLVSLRVAGGSRRCVSPPAGSASGSRRSRPRRLPSYESPSGAWRWRGRSRSAPICSTCTRPTMASSAPQPPPGPPADLIRWGCSTAEWGSRSPMSR